MFGIPAWLRLVFKYKEVSFKIKSVNYFCNSVVHHIKRIFAYFEVRKF